MAQQEKVEIYIQEEMDVGQRGWLVMKLQHERGIVDAWFEGEDPHRLMLQYEPEHFSHLTLLDTIKEYGFHGDFVNA